jgi:hypothetical protein
LDIQKITWFTKEQFDEQFKSFDSEIDEWKKGFKKLKRRFFIRNYTQYNYQLLQREMGRMDTYNIHINLARII